MKRCLLSLFLAVIMTLSFASAGLADGPSPAPETTAEPEVITEAETAPEQEPSVEQEPTAEPEAATEPEATTEPEVVAEPEATVGPETAAEPAADVGPMPAAETRCTVHFSGALEGLISAVDESGETVPDGGSFSVLTVTVKENYSIRVGYGEISLDRVTVHAEDIEDDVLDVTIIAPAVLKFTGALDGIDGFSNDGGYGSLEEGFIFPITVPIGIEGLGLTLKPGYRLKQTGYVSGGIAAVTEMGYDFDADMIPTGLWYMISLHNGGNVTLEIVEDSSALPPDLVKITFEGDAAGSVYEARGDCVRDGEIYSFVGSSVIFGLSGAVVTKAEGASLVYDDIRTTDFWYVCQVDEDAQSVTITVEKNDGAALYIGGDTQAVIPVELTEGKRFTSGILYLKPDYTLDKIGQFDGYTVLDAGVGYRDYDVGEYHAYYIVAQGCGEVTVNVVESQARDTPRYIPVRISDPEKFDSCFGTCIVSGDMVLQGSTVPVCSEDEYDVRDLIIQGGSLVSREYDAVLLFPHWVYTIQVDEDAVELSIEVKDVVLGDVDGSGGEPDLKDVVELFRSLLGVVDDVSMRKGDMTGDGVIDLKDVTKLFQAAGSQSK